MTGSILLIVCAATTTASTADTASAGTGVVAWHPGVGVVLGVDDGPWQLALGLRAQLLYGFLDSPIAAHSMALRRARTSFKGQLARGRYGFALELALSPRDVGQGQIGDLGDGVSVVQTSPLLDAYVDLRLLRDLEIRLGQYKVPFNRQRVTSSGAMQMVDRSVSVNGEFNVDRNVGFDLRSSDLLGLGQWRYYAGLYLGAGRNPAGAPLPVTNGFWLGLARLEFLPFGMFEDYDEGDRRKTERPSLSVGAAFAYLSGAPNDRGVLGAPLLPGRRPHYHLATVDTVFKCQGFSLLVEAVARRSANGSRARSAWGGMIQSGLFLYIDVLELVARAGVNRPLSSRTTFGDADQTNEMGVGLNAYLGGELFKVQGDVFRLRQLKQGAVNEVRLQVEARL